MTERSGLWLKGRTLTRKPSFLCVLLLVSCAHDGDRSGGPELMVKVDGAGCSVQGQIVECAELASYMRDNIKIPIDTYIAVAPASGNARADDIIPVVKSLMNAGFRLVIGSVSALQERK